MDAVSMRHMARLAEWRKRILECGMSGMTVKTWCAENHISSKTYYRWKRLCLAEGCWDENASAQMTGALSESETCGKLVKVDPHRLRDAVKKGEEPQDKITLRYGNLSVEMPCGTPVVQLAELMKALVSEC